MFAALGLGWALLQWTSSLISLSLSKCSCSDVCKDASSLSASPTGVSLWFYCIWLFCDVCPAPWTDASEAQQLLQGNNHLINQLPGEALLIKFGSRFSRLAEVNINVRRLQHRVARDYDDSPTVTSDPAQHTLVMEGDPQQVTDVQHRLKQGKYLTLNSVWSSNHI